MPPVEKIDPQKQTRDVALTELEGRQPNMVVRCRECGRPFRAIIAKHLWSAHGLTVAKYVLRHPDAPISAKGKRLCPFCEEPQASIRDRTCGSAECLAERNRRKNTKQRKQCREVELNGPDAAEKFVECMVCGGKYGRISGTHLMSHNMSELDYRRRFPGGAALLSLASSWGHAKSGITRMKFPSYGGQPPDNKFFEFMAGGLLGDFHLAQSSRNTFARYSESGSNQKYLSFKVAFLKRYVPCRLRRGNKTPDPRTGKIYRKWLAKSTQTPVFTSLRSIWYSGQTKIVPRQFLERYMTPLALAIWFCDDGHAEPNHNGGNIATLGFTIEDVQYLQDLLRRKFGIITTLQLKKNNRPLIILPPDARQRIIDLIKPFNIPGMAYKSKALPRPRKVVLSPEQRPGRQREYLARYRAKQGESFRERQNELSRLRYRTDPEPKRRSTEEYRLRNADAIRKRDRARRNRKKDDS
jgi:predicted transcriptional regulator